MSRLQKIYKDQIVSQLMEKFDYKSPMQAPRLSKITINMGVGQLLVIKKF
jgi:large subunit ribosomal protein L5